MKKELEKIKAGLTSGNNKSFWVNSLATLHRYSGKAIQKQCVEIATQYGLEVHYINGCMIAN